jgi:transposase
LDEHIKKKYGVDYKPAVIYKLLHVLGFSFQRAKTGYPERDGLKRTEVRSDIKKLADYVEVHDTVVLFDD